MNATPGQDLDLLVIGELNVDLILTGADVAPEFGQVEKLVEGAAVALGGSSALLAAGAARLGMRVAFAGKVGDDVFGRFLKSELAEHCVDTTSLLIAPGEKTGLTVHLSRPGDRAMLTYPGTMATFRAEDIAGEFILRARHVHSSSLYLQPALQPGLPGLFRMARELDATTSLDPGWDPSERWEAGFRSILPHLTLFLPNEQEVTRIAGIVNVEAAAGSLTSMGTTVVVKRGAKGALLATPTGTRSFPAYPARPVDTTGAGDTFNAGLLCALAHGQKMDEAVRWGLACGAMAVEAVGGTGGQPTLAELYAYLDHAHGDTSQGGQ